MDVPTFSILVASAAVVAAGAALQGAVGFGLAVVAAPVLVMLDPALVPGPLILAALVLAGLVTIRDRSGIELRGLGAAVAGRLVGAPVGAFVLVLLPGEGLPLLVAFAVLFAVAVSAAGVRLPRTTPVLLGAGFLSGVLGTATSIGGPPMALVYQHAAGQSLRGTLGGYFVFSTFYSLLVLFAVGRFGAGEAVAGAALVPGVVAGFYASDRLARRLDRSGRTRAAILGVAALAGLVAIVRALS